MKQLILPFEDFLTYLQQQGFDLGVDDFLQIQALLNLLPEDCPPEKLKSLLAPLVVGNEEEQTTFYRAFDRYFEEWIQHQAVEELTVAPKKAAKKTPFKTKEKREEETRYDRYAEKEAFYFNDFLQEHFKTIGGVFVGLFLLVMGTFLYFNMPVETPDSKAKIESVQHEETRPISKAKTPKKQKKTVEKTAPKPTNKTETESSLSQKKSNPRGWEMKNPPPTTPSPKEQDKTWKMDTNLSKEFSRKKAKSEMYFNQSIGFWLFVTIVSLLYVMWIVRWYAKSQKEFQLQALENIRPPQYWNIRVPKSELNLTHSKAFRNAATQLQTRKTIPTQRIDVPETISSTIAAAGFPSFEFQRRSEMPEYLILIDQSSIKDQQTRWFDMWFEALKQQEVLVHRYFFNYQIESLWEWDAEKRRISMKEVQRRFGDCRLVVITQPPPLSPSKGEGKQNVSSEKISPPLEGTKGRFSGDAFSDWKEKILLSTTNLSKTEIEFWQEKGFTVLPAKTKNLHQLVAVLEGKKTMDSKELVSSFIPATDWKSLNVRETLKELKRQLNPMSFRWLCATAVYPELNWDLTLLIGETLFDETELIKEENVLPLVSLPWFRKGEMPEKLRRVLLKELSEDDKKMAKEAIMHLLQLYPLIADEYHPDFFDYQLYIALERVRMNPKDSESLKELYKLSYQQQFQDSRYKTVILRYLDEQKDSLPLGDSFEKWFEHKDYARAVGAGKFFYPRPDFKNRWDSMVVRTMRMGMINMFVIIFFAVAYESMGLTYNMSFWFGLLAALLGCYKTADGVVGGWHNDAADYLVLVNARTNQEAGFFKTILRRSVDLLPLAVMAVLVYVFQLNMLYFWGAFALLSIVNLVMIDVGKGRRLGDFLLGTQVANKVDFDKGFWNKEE
ncbi:MAG: hypothetical protein ACPGVB_13210 [Chitinophagales bacterium]